MGFRSYIKSFCQAMKAVWGLLGEVGTSVAEVLRLPGILSPSARRTGDQQKCSGQDLVSEENEDLANCLWPAILHSRPNSAPGQKFLLLYS